MPQTNTESAYVYRYRRRTGDRSTPTKVILQRRRLRHQLQQAYKDMDDLTLLIRFLELANELNDRVTKNNQ